MKGKANHAMYASEPHYWTEFLMFLKKYSEIISEEQNMRDMLLG